MKREELEKLNIEIQNKLYLIFKDTKDSRNDNTEVLASFFLNLLFAIKDRVPKENQKVFIKTLVDLIEYINSDKSKGLPDDPYGVNCKQKS